MGGGHYQNARPDSAIVSSQAPCFGNATTLRPYPRQHVIQGSGRLSCSHFSNEVQSHIWKILKPQAHEHSRFPILESSKVQMLWKQRGSLSDRDWRFHTFIMSCDFQELPWLPNIKVFHVLRSLFKAMDRGIQWAHNCSIHSRVLLLGQCWSAPRCKHAVQERGFLREGHAGFTILVANCDDTCAPPDHSNYNKYCGIQCFGFMGAMVLGL